MPKWSLEIFPAVLLKISADLLDSVCQALGWVDQDEAAFVAAYCPLVFLEPPRKDVGIPEPHIYRELLSPLLFAMPQGLGCFILVP